MRWISARFDQEHRRFLSGAAILTVLAASGQGVYLLMLPVISRLYPAADYGLFAIYMAIVNMSAPLVNLKLESALHSSKEVESQERILATSLFFTALLTVLASTGVYVLLATGVLPDDSSFHNFVYYLPAGIFLSGCWDIATAWAIRRKLMRNLSIARFLQPTVMAFLHVGLGLAGLGVAGLLLGSNLAYLAYFLIIMTSSGRGLMGRLVRIPIRGLLAQVRREWEFPAFAAPAQLLLLALVNLPQIMVGLAFGHVAVGHFGLAYRVVAAPMQVLSMPLSNTLTAYLSNHEKPLRRSVVLLVPAAAISLMSLPLLIVAALAPFAVDLIFPAEWQGVAPYISVLAVGGAFQAVAMPFYESYAVLRRQRARLYLSAIRLPLVILGFAIPWYMGLGPIYVVGGMVVGNSIGYVILIADALVHALRYVGRGGNLTIGRADER